jgi:opacity protein-like surface antigen
MNMIKNIPAAVALLSFCAMASAQTTEPSSGSSAPDYSIYFGVGGSAYYKFKTKTAAFSQRDSDAVNNPVLKVGFGYRFNSCNEIGFSAGIGSSTQKEAGISERGVNAPFRLGYRFYFPVGERNRIEPHIGVSGGFNYQHAKLRGNGQRVSQIALAPAYEISAGVRLHLTDATYLDYCYSFSQTGYYKFKIGGDEIKTRVTAGHSLGVSLGYQY